MSTPEKSAPVNFIRHIINRDLETNKYGGRIATRFPPEPNGYLHIGHAKSICLNFGIAEDYPNATCNMRFDDTNPTKEEMDYVNSILEDVRWLGFQWADDVKYTSDYFDQLYDYAVELINQGKAYVCSLSADEIRQSRGTLTEPGKDSPYRNRTVEENLGLFTRMRNGEFKNGEHVLRAKIDMSSPNINMRDPVIYRIMHASHHQTGDKWCVYPMYDYSHPIADALEGITHSLCTLEFEDHRPLYDWVLDNITIDCHPQQIEFARLSLEHTVMSKRKLMDLVNKGYVDGWDDPRMPTIAGIRRRGYTPASIRDFCDRIGITKVDTVIEMGVLEHTVRDDLDANASRAMCVLNPLKIVIENYPADKTEIISAARHPKIEALGKREFPFSREIYIDRSDFEEVPPKGFKRLIPGGEVRLRNAYVIKCEEIIKDDNGNIIELRCTHDENTLGKNPEGRKVKGVIHWVSASDCVDVEVRLYDRLFKEADPVAISKSGDLNEQLNPDSLTILEHCKAEKSLASAKAGEQFQFEREGYFCVDSKHSTPDKLVFNRTVTLRDTWAKIQQKSA
ncbi:MAG: glutamine--tRNA ligase/YqeY domain fusion protein [Gammaproteobacteria bacterium]|nr:glutamine--tRNA ligase/YqeY domain fusion protein [Gammaproteobacteria bacterium]